MCVNLTDSPLDAFSEIGPTLSDTSVTALTKPSTSQKALDNRLIEMSKKFEERNMTLSNQLESVLKLQTESEQNQPSQPQRGSFGNSRGQNSQNPGYRDDNRGRYRGNNGR